MLGQAGKGELIMELMVQTYAIIKDDKITGQHQWRTAQEKPGSTSIWGLDEGGGEKSHKIGLSTDITSLAVSWE